MLLCFSFMGIYWFKVAELGEFSLEAYHVGMLCIVTATCASFYSPAPIFRVLVYCTPWFLAYLAYLIFFIPAAAGTPAVGLLVRQTLFVAGFLCIAAYFLRTRTPAKSLRRGALIGFVLYIAFTEYSARQIDKSLVTATADFLASGSFRNLTYGFFRPVFNSFEDGTDLAFVASLTNSVAVSLLVLCICFRIGYAKRGLDVIGVLFTLSTIVFALLLDARSVVLAAFVSFLVAFLIRLMTARAVSLTEMLGWCFAVIVFVSVVYVAAIGSTSALDSIASAFQFRDSSVESRWSQYSWALGLIEDRLIWGHGYLENEQGYPIHNLFLSSWAYSGFVGFALISMFYFGLVFAWLRWLYLAITRQDYWTLTLRPEWVAVLPVLPLFRMWISGAGGLPGYGEWIALGVFVGLVMRNDLERRSMAEPGASDIISIQPRKHYASGWLPAAVSLDQSFSRGNNFRLPGERH
jgi:hypothetical protein